MTDTATNPAAALRTSIDTAIRRAIRPWYLPPTVRARATDTVLDAVSGAVLAAAQRGRDAGTLEAQHRDAKAQETALRLSRESARREALEEAAVMLARGGHRSAVTKVRDMAAVPAEASEPTP